MTQNIINLRISNGQYSFTILNPSSSNNVITYTGLRTQPGLWGVRSNSSGSVPFWGVLGF